MTAKAAASVAAEIRAHVKAFPSEKRIGFIQRAIADRDETTVSSLLGAPSYLSGLDAKMQSV